MSVSTNHLFLHMSAISPDGRFYIVVLALQDGGVGAIADVFNGIIRQMTNDVDDKYCRPYSH